MTVYALALLACSNRPAVLLPPTEIEHTQAFVLELGGVPIANEERISGRFTGEPTVWRKRTYAWEIDGVSMPSVAVTRAMQMSSGQTVAYARQLNEQPIESWTGVAWLPEIAAAQGALPTGEVTALIPERLDVETVKIAHNGADWSWTSNGAMARLTVTSEGPTARWGGLVLRPIPQAVALDAVDPVGLLRRSMSAKANARNSRRALFLVDGQPVEITVPLWAELPSDEPVSVPSEHAAWKSPRLDAPIEIRALAEEIATPEASRRDTVKRLVTRVQQMLRVAPSPGTPDALQALQSGRGDCNEHAELLVALAKSLGIPARTVAGAVYTEDGPWGPGLDLHAWAEVWMAEQWVPVDPALGQTIADATHLPLARDGRIEQSLGPWMSQEIVLQRVY